MLWAQWCLNQDTKGYGHNKNEQDTPKLQWKLMMPNRVCLPRSVRFPTAESRTAWLRPPTYRTLHGISWPKTFLNAPFIMASPFSKATLYLWLSCGRASIHSHQVPRLPRETAAPASSQSLQRVTKCRACHARHPRGQASRGSTESRQVPRLPLETAAAWSIQRPYRESPSAVPATQSRRGVNGVQGDQRLQRVTRCRACHAKQPRRRASRGQSPNAALVRRTSW